MIHPGHEPSSTRTALRAEYEYEYDHRPIVPGGPWTPTLLTLLTTACHPTPPLVHHQPLPQQAYVWQRDISPTLLTEIHQRAPSLDGLILLAAELDLQSSPPRQIQVHSLSRPTHRDDPFTLCDPDAARKAVLKAARAGIPFRVALPTYAYLAAFNAQGQFLGASAEGPPPQRPPDTTYRELAADPTTLAQLIQEWSHTRPTTLTGVIWYRLPLSSDRWNWRWPTLASVMQGQPPQSRVLAHLDASQPGLFELRLTQDGSADHAGPLTARLRWSHAPLLAHDAIRRFQATPTPDGLAFHHHTLRLRPGDAIVAGWLRLGSNVPVQVELAIPSYSHSYSAQRAALALENNQGAPHATSPRASMSSDAIPVQSSPP